MSRLPGVRRGGVAVFPASDAQGGTERLVMLAEICEDTEANHTRILAEINGLAVDLIGMPADDIMLAPSRTVQKTSSGKVRRAADAVWAAWASAVYLAIVPLKWRLIAAVPVLMLRRRIARARAAGPGATGIKPAQLAGQEGPLIVVANHASHLDALIFSVVPPPYFTYVAKHELLKKPLAAIPCGDSAAPAGRSCRLP